MAELSQDGGGGKKHKGGPKQKKKSTRIDMTAMVDVAFLLLTFFILTTTLATPQSMVVNKPPKNEDEDPTKEVKVDEKKVMTLILGERDRIHYYKGITDPQIQTTKFSAGGLRKVIMEHFDKPNLCRTMGMKTAEEIRNSGCWDPIFVIKCNKTAKFSNLVDILDEMAILNIPKYAYTELTPMDSTLLALSGLK